MRKPQARGEDAPRKVDDHGPDALRYAVMAARFAWLGWLSTPPPEVGEQVDRPLRRVRR